QRLANVIETSDFDLKRFDAKASGKAPYRCQAGPSAQRLAPRTHWQSAATGIIEANGKRPFVVVLADQHLAYRAALGHDARRIFLNASTHFYLPSARLNRANPSRITSKKGGTIEETKPRNTNEHVFYR
ncbi:hypothetical protein, partial [Pseudomonas viridiflava]|uniref:hypothetical protein n=1 Tax=Pseudomonas viridiflava TaxID=33069 RepID=UPI0013C2A0F3